MTPSERRKAFEAARNRVVRDHVGLMKNTRDDIVKMLKESLVAVKQILAGQPSDYQQWALPRLGQEIRQALAEYGVKASGRISTAAGAAWQLGEDLVERPLAASGIRLALASISTRQLDAMRAFMVDRIKDVGLDAANRINAELGLVVIGAQSPGDAVTSATQILGEHSRARATTIVRTELARAFEVAASEKLVQTAAQVPGMKKQWRRSGKLHPRLHHYLADGQVREIGEPFVLKPFGKAPVRLMFPHDPAAPASEVINCGCVSLPWKADWKVAQPGRAPESPELAGESLQAILARAPKAPEPAIR